MKNALHNFVATLLLAIALGCPAFAQTSLGQQVFTGVGSPEGVQVGNPGDAFLSWNGAEYIKNSGNGKTGWVQIALSGATPGNLTGDVTSVGLATTIATGSVTDDKASLEVKPSVGMVATSNLTLSGAQTIDGVLGVAGTTLVLATAQSTGSQNGPWIMQSGAWTRPAWYPSGGTTQALRFSSSFARLGTNYSGTTWRLTTVPPITIDTTATTWMQTPLALNSTSVNGILPHAQLPTLLSGDIPTNAANTSGTASNLSGTPALPNGTTATSQSVGDNTNDLATDAFVQSTLAAPGPIGGTTPAAGTFTAITSGKAVIPGYPSVPSSDLFMGTTAGNAGNSSLTGTASVGIGQNALAAMTVPASGANPQADTVVGYNACPSVTTAREMICIGYNAGAVFTGNGTGVQDGLSTFIGSQAGQAMVGGSAGVSDFICIGQKSCTNLTGGGAAIFLGNHAGAGLVTGNGSVILGNTIIDSTVGATSLNDVIIGYNAAHAGTGAFSSNVLIGKDVASTATATTDNVIIGYQAGQNVTTGTQNTMIGSKAGQTISSSASNVFVGFHAAQIATGANETAIGYQACSNMTGGSNDYSLCLGNNTTLASAADTYETVIGSNVAGSGPGTATVGSNTLTLIGPNGQTFGAFTTRGSSACETTFGITTLGTGATTTDTGLNCLPANAVIEAVVYRITTTITTAASFTIGDATTSARFCGTQSVLTTGTTGICFAQADQTGASGPRQTSAAKVRVTLNANPGAGAIRLIVYYHTWTAPTS